MAQSPVMAAREAVDRALELSLREGILYERRIFHALFATQDQREGMNAFVEKRDAVFAGR
ncbi:MAG: enoyl-CoA hydratase-related protein [Caldilineaceae bacterium]